MILAAWTAGALALCAAIGILPTYRWAGRPGVAAMAVAAIAVWAVAAAGAVPVAVARPADPKGLLQAVLAAMGIRFALTLAVAAALLLGTSLPRVTLSAWVAVCYVVALFVATTVELRLARSSGSEASS